MLTRSPAWKALENHFLTMQSQHMRELFQSDPQRAQRYQLEACGLTLDYSKNIINDETLSLLSTLAEQQSLTQKREAMFAGENINHTESRAVLHTALRSNAKQLSADGENIMPGVHASLEKMAKFVTAVRNGTHKGYSGKAIQTVVNIGVGGSDLGPKMVTTALRELADEHAPLVLFVSNIDQTHFETVAAGLDPETTLFIIASKTFTTHETMLNAQRAREWFVARSDGKGDTTRHFVAVSAALAETKKFGISDANVFAFWDWVGGRYSLWSAIGLPIALNLGMDRFRELLAGARAMDSHFFGAPLLQNMPVLLALIGVWYNNFFGAHQHLILPYNYSMKEFPSYIQQLDMESNGKSVDIDGNPVDYATGPVVWGELGSNAQHAFFQLLHQGTHIVPADFIISKPAANQASRRPLTANYVAQTQALMRGKNKKEIKPVEHGESAQDSAVYKVFAGNRPTNAIVMHALDASTLGALIALYEHKVFSQGVIWHINSFDQFGVELGKQLERQLAPVMAGETVDADIDTSTLGLIDTLR